MRFVRRDDKCTYPVYALQCLESRDRDRKMRIAANTTSHRIWVIIALLLHFIIAFLSSCIFSTSVKEARSEAMSGRARRAPARRDSGGARRTSY